MGDDHHGCEDEHEEKLGGRGGVHGSFSLAALRFHCEVRLDE